MTVKVVAVAKIDKGRIEEEESVLKLLDKVLTFSSLTKACASLGHGTGPGDSGIILIPDPKRPDDPEWRERGEWLMFVPDDPTDESEDRDQTMYLVREAKK